jgi:hypothetical protein
MTISMSRQQEMLRAQSVIARKVFEYVPMQEAWTAQAISHAMTQQTRASIQFRRLQGCLNTLKEAGLVSEPMQGCFQQITPREKIKAMPQRDETPTPRTQPGAVELLRELADRARALALDIDAAADVVGEERVSNDEAARKLQTLQSILKSLA